MLLAFVFSTMEASEIEFESYEPKVLSEPGLEYDEKTLFKGFQNIIEDMRSAIQSNDMNKKFLLVVYLSDFINSCPEELKNDMLKLYHDTNEEYSAWKVSLEVGDTVDLFWISHDDSGRWYETKLSKDDQAMTMTPSTFSLHFLGWDKKYDETHDINKFMVLPKNTITKVMKRGKTRDRNELNTFSQTMNSVSDSSLAVLEQQQQNSQINIDEEVAAAKVMTVTSSGMIERF